MRHKFIMMTLIALFLLSINGEAARIDVYRDALLNKSFTLKYEVITLPIRRTNKEATIKKGTFKPVKFVDVNANDIMPAGIIVVDGNDKYIESNLGTCTLIKDNEKFNYYWYIKKGQKHYYGGYNAFSGHSKSVSNENDGKSLTPYNMFYSQYFYGDATLSNALVPILPLDRIIATPDTPQYKFVASGTLDNGLSYEDFYGNKNNIFYAVRYYFNGDKLVKIATAKYTKNGAEIINYEKAVIAINEFSTTPDKNYLSLPEELKVKNKHK